MASTSKEKEVSLVTTEDGSIAEMKTQHEDEMQEDPETYKADKDLDFAFILEKLRHTKCSFLLKRFFDSNTILHLAANSGHVQTVEKILSIQQCQKLLTAKNSSGDLPLHVAANAGHLSIVQRLVSSLQCQELLMAKNSDGNLPLHVAAKAGHLSIVQRLVSSLQYCQELLMAKNSDGNLPLHVAAKAGHLSIVQQLVKSSYECQELLMEKNSSSVLPVQLFVESSHQCEELLMAQNSNVNVACELLTVKNKEGNTPLHLALIKKYEEVDMNLKSKYNEVAKFLIKAVGGMHDDRIVEDNKCSLDMARKADDEELSELISEFAIICHQGIVGIRICAIAQNDAEMKRIDYINSIKPELERGPQKSKDKVTSMNPILYKAVNSKNIGFIENKAQETECPALSDKTPKLNTMLHLAAASSDDDQFVQAILGIQLCKNFVTEKNSNGELPLHVAASAGNMKIVKLLVELSSKKLKDDCDCVSLVEKNMEENTPLHLALIKKFQVGRNSALKAKYNKVAKFLVEKCPEVCFYPNKERKSPLYLAAEGGDEELVKHMITTNGLPYGKSFVHAVIYYLMTITNLPYGKSIVHAAIYGSFSARKKDILDTVLESLPNDILTVKDDKGMTPLFYAASIGYLKGVESLLRKTEKCGVYEGDTHGYYPIHIASWEGHIKVVEKFLHEYPDMIELLTDAGQNILHLAAMNGKARVVAYMLKRHDLKVEMLINNEDLNGNTPLHLAAMKRHPMVVCILTWDKRVDLKALNKEGKRALDIALNYSGEKPSFRERLTWEALRYVSSPRAPPRHISGENPQCSKVAKILSTDSSPEAPPRCISGENPQCSKVGKTLSTDEYKDRTDTLLLVATLVATVTFAAAFTMPGGYKESGGMAKFLEKPMFHVFVISNSIAMYSAITAVVTLIWAHLDDLNLFIAAYKISVPILGLAITMVSLAFMAGNYLVLRDLNWLAYLLLSIGSFFLFTLSIIFFPLCLPNSSPHPIIRYILRYPFYLLIKFTGYDTDGRKEE